MLRSNITTMANHKSSPERQYKKLWRLRGTVMINTHSNIITAQRCCAHLIQISHGALHTDANRRKQYYEL